MFDTITITSRLLHMHGASLTGPDIIIHSRIHCRLLPSLLQPNDQQELYVEVCRADAGLDVVPGDDVQGRPGSQGSTAGYPPSRTNPPRDLPGPLLGLLLHLSPLDRNGQNLHH